jgi:16S rRNA (cytosine1402-N4)-methyltransferase
MDEHGHLPVLMAPILDLLDPRPGEVVLDCTVGRGGHSAAFADRVGPEGRIIGFDLDAANLAYTTERLAAIGMPFTPIRDSFVRVSHHLRSLGARADVVLADLGFSSSQMDDPARGLSFQADGPLDMRLDPDGPVTAADLIATLDERELARILFEYGEEPLARGIARKLVQIRTHEPIHSTARLAQLVEEVYGPRARRSRRHPATKTFMALRIACNDELGALRALLQDVERAAAGSERDTWLASGARVGIVSFHSLEDRLVKRSFVALEERGLATRLTRRPVIADEHEQRANPRARSAKLRVARMATPTTT